MIDRHYHNGIDSNQFNSLAEILSGLPLPPLTTKLTLVSADAPAIPNYSLSGHVTNSSAYGLSTADDFKTLLTVVINLQNRVNDLEARLKTIVLVK